MQQQYTLKTVIKVISQEQINCLSALFLMMVVMVSYICFGVLLAKNYNSSANSLVQANHWVAYISPLLAVAFVYLSVVTKKVAIKIISAKRFKLDLFDNTQLTLVLTVIGYSLYSYTGLHEEASSEYLQASHYLLAVTLFIGGVLIGRKPSKRQIDKDGLIRVNTSYMSKKIKYTTIQYTHYNFIINLISSVCLLGTMLILTLNI